MLRVLFDGVVTPDQPDQHEEPQAVLDPSPNAPSTVRFELAGVAFTQEGQTAHGTPFVSCSIGLDPGGSGAWGLNVVYVGQPGENGPPAELFPATVSVRVTE